mmetsp:Transcript_15950/g.64347  ORF Transcript_15950/g.64347 Transcript_15950/m.64347 type:complete len:131 (+) Transcript_15950:488-880(+)
MDNPVVTRLVVRLCRAAELGTVGVTSRSLLVGVESEGAAVVAAEGRARCPVFALQAAHLRNVAQLRDAFVFDARRARGVAPPPKPRTPPRTAYHFVVEVRVAHPPRTSRSHHTDPEPRISLLVGVAPPIV